MAGLKLYNTLTRKKEDFSPLNPDQVRMYVCGPTVYDFAHIGNARPVIVFDVLYRLLRHLYGADKVTYARNITDVDDKINARAARQYPDMPSNEAIRKLTEETNAQFQADVTALGCLPPTTQPRATEHIDEMKALCERLVQRGVAYVAEGHVLFSPEAMNSHQARGHWPVYGKLANRSLDEMIAGARVDVAPYKKGQTDFVLWKPSNENEPGWPSPCGIKGNGRPGWHIECSAMSMAKLLAPFGGGLSCDDPVKNTFDIHGGGIDLVFPHHENEIAQSCCAFGSDKMAQVWMHNGFLQVEGQKMSKSLGNFVTINELLATEKFGGRTWPPEVLRLAMLKTHYRQPIDWTVRALKEAESKLDQWTVYQWFDNVDDDGSVLPRSKGDEYLSRLVEALSDDLNTWEAFRAIDDAFKANVSNKIFEKMLEIVGLDVKKYSQDRSDENASILSQEMSGIDQDLVTHLINRRLEARAAKNWAESDRIRDELAAKGIQLKDGKGADGQPVTTWEVKR